MEPNQPTDNTAAPETANDKASTPADMAGNKNTPKVRKNPPPAANTNTGPSRSKKVHAQDPMWFVPNVNFFDEGADEVQAPPLFVQPGARRPSIVESLLTSFTGYPASFPPTPTEQSLVIEQSTHEQTPSEHIPPDQTPSEHIPPEQTPSEQTLPTEQAPSNQAPPEQSPSTPPPPEHDSSPSSSSPSTATPSPPRPTRIPHPAMRRSRHSRRRYRPVSPPNPVLGRTRYALSPIKEETDELPSPTNKKKKPMSEKARGKMPATELPSPTNKKKKKPMSEKARGKMPATDR